MSVCTPICACVCVCIRPQRISTPLWPAVCEGEVVTRMNTSLLALWSAAISSRTNREEDVFPYGVSLGITILVLKPIDSSEQSGILPCRQRRVEKRWWVDHNFMQEYGKKHNSADRVAESACTIKSPKTERWISYQLSSLHEVPDVVSHVCISDTQLVNGFCCVICCLAVRL